MHYLLLFMETIFTRTHLDVALYVHCLSFFQTLPNPKIMGSSVWLYLHWMTPATLPLRSVIVVTVIRSVVVSRKVF